MTTLVLTQPLPLVTVEEAKTALGESGTDRDDLIAGLILAAQSELDGPKGWVGISVAEQTLQATFGTFDDLRLAYGPVLGDIDVSYVDADGDDQTLDPGTYALAADGSVVLADGQSWPTLYDGADPVTVIYDVGIDDQDDPRIAQMKTAIIMHVRMALDMVAPEVHRRALESLVRSMWVVNV